ncbi:protoporphyrinogen oxidase HemJ [Pseudomonas sp. 5P_3.1_Bac2]|uniref:protoporphyrinogen oxidase HemJ n=1 Tax=Pseudomonas sp. 5P_3.1_Bac2 TaxID=2971617 RepID=UPI0021C91E49|nr:protoporphyrinogen oxidase HemJ [Pseudomonas sp. 5P_3.1_Bac2]MCU1717497.1 protoporphyrinogen oxidase HemJ [Pseudomonas sp. 5P_3.1_Bac2]
MLYLWLKALHIIAMVCWFAGLFYLPRLFVYHAMSSDPISRERFCLMERKLYRGIMWPSLVLTVLLGAALISLNPSYYLSQGWLHAKLSIVALLVVYQFFCGAQIKAFARDENPRGHVFYRWFNEAPVFALLAIVILVVVRPF